MRVVAGSALILLASTSFADGYGLTWDAPSSRPVGQQESAGGYGLVPTSIERQGVVRVPRAESDRLAGRRAQSKRYLSAASNPATNVVPAAQPSRWQPAAAEPVSVAQRTSRYEQRPVQQLASADRYSQVQIDTRKSYRVSPVSNADLSGLMRAPVTFAQGEQQPVRSLNQLAAPRPAAAVAVATPVNLNSAVAAAPRAGGPDFSALKARLKQPVAPAPQPIQAAAKPASGMPDFSALKARIGKPEVSQPAPAPKKTVDGLPDMSALKARLAATSDPRKPVAQAAVKPAIAQVTPAVPAAKPVSPVQLSPVTTTASNSGMNGFFDNIADLLGAESVKPWQKSKLAEQSMKKGGAIPALSKFSSKVHVSKEASRGGYGVAGGGCGCN